LLNDDLISDYVGGEKITLKYNKEENHHRVTDSSGDPIPSVAAFWFAWQAFYPETEIWTD
jgi:hypothetical protein